MSIRDEVTGGIPHSAAAAMTAGLARMGSPDLDVVVTEDFVNIVRALANDPEYHDDRNGSSVAARAVSTADGASIVVVNWDVFSEFTETEGERVMAHEVGHVSINSRTESPTSHASEKFTDDWNFQIAYGVDIAIDEFRCEAAAYAAGYPTGPGLTDDDMARDLFDLNIQLLLADHKYQSHLDVRCLRSDVLTIVSLHLLHMAKFAARHLHFDSFAPSTLNRFARANWKALVAPTWDKFLNIYQTIPTALTPWSGSAPTDAAVALARVVSALMSSFGYEATADYFWIHMSNYDRRVRLARANDERDFLDSLGS